MQVPGRQPGSAYSLAWGFVAAVAGSLCCIGPAAAVLLGLGASSALAALQLGRTPASLLGLGLLALGVALAMRRGAACGLGRARRLRAPALMLLAFGLCYWGLAYALPAAAAQRIAAAPVVAPPAAPAAVEVAQARRLTLSIEKMDCAPCVAQVNRLLAEQGGVLAFVALAESDEVTVDYLPAEVAAATLAHLFPPSYGVRVLGDAPLP